MAEQGMKAALSIFWLILLVMISDARAKVIRVPDDYTRIQEAIDVSQKNDVIMVDQGTYYENIHIEENRCLIGAGSELTILLDTGKGPPDPVVEIAGEVLLQGFTITGARGSGVGHAVMILRGAPMIVDNIIRDNAYTAIGVHSQVSFTAPIIAGNKIFGNGGAGIANLGKFSKAVIINNEIFNNTNVGIACTDSAGPRIENNHIHDNGAGVALKDEADTKVRNNQVVGNKLVGVNVSRKAKGTIRNNNIMSNGSTGINVESSPYTLVKKNTIVDNGAEGVFVKNKSKAVVDRNIIFGNLPTLVQYIGSEVTFTNNQVYAQESVETKTLAVIVRKSKMLTANNEIQGGFDLDEKSVEIRLNKKARKIKPLKTQLQTVVDKKSPDASLQVRPKSCWLFR
ncbi:MAG: nitrous oxide reductase family maturation protein NosD [bacterium]